jgi:hypothetical protein
MLKQDRSARRGWVRMMQRVGVALGSAIVVLWVMAHLVEVVFAVALIAYATGLAGRIARF